MHFKVCPETGVFAATVSKLETLKCLLASVLRVAGAVTSHAITVPTPQSGRARCGNHSLGVQKRHNSSGLSEVGVAGTLGQWDQ